MGRFGALFLYLEMPELGAETQGAGGYCRAVYRWILRNWNAEIPCIIGTPRLISVLSRFSRGQRLRAPTVPRRSQRIWLKILYVVEGIERCSTQILWPDWTTSSWRERVAKFFEMGRVWNGISLSGDTRTGMREPNIGGIL